MEKVIKFILEGIAGVVIFIGLLVISESIYECFFLVGKFKINPCIGAEELEEVNQYLTAVKEAVAFSTAISILGLTYLIDIYLKYTKDEEE